MNLKSLSLGESVTYENEKFFVYFSKVLTKNENLTKVFAYLMQVENKQNGKIVRFPLINPNEINKEKAFNFGDLTFVKLSKLKKYEVNSLGDFI